MTDSCCSGSWGCEGGVPLSCSIECAAVFAPFYEVHCKTLHPFRLHNHGAIKLHTLYHKRMIPQACHGRLAEAVDVASLRKYEQVCSRTTTTLHTPQLGRGLPGIFF